jgi:hypothetical protein
MVNLQSQNKDGNKECIIKLERTQKVRFFCFHKFNSGCLDDDREAIQAAGRELIKHWYTKKNIFFLKSFLFFLESFEKKKKQNRIPLS